MQGVVVCIKWEGECVVIGLDQGRVAWQSPPSNFLLNKAEGIVGEIAAATEIWE